VSFATGFDSGVPMIDPFEPQRNRKVGNGHTVPFSDEYQNAWKLQVGPTNNRYGISEVAANTRALCVIVCALICSRRQKCRDEYEGAGDEGEEGEDATKRRRCEDATEHFNFTFIQTDSVDSYSYSYRTAYRLQQSAAAAVASAASLSGQGTDDELYRTAGCDRRASILLPAR
jgi:hypothetical protein